MPSRDRPTDRARRVTDRDLARLGDELRTARIGAGLTLRFVGARVGRSAAQVMRVERGMVPNASVRLLGRIGAVVGLDVRLRAYPGPDPVRDVAQARLLSRFIARLDPRLSVQTEVPLPIPGDVRAWDAWLSGFAAPNDGVSGLPVDAETRLYDVQALLRRLAIKLRDSQTDCMILLVADTRANRHAVAGAAGVLAPVFPVRPRRALAALRSGEHPGGSALVLL